MRLTLGIIEIPSMCMLVIVAAVSAGIRCARGTNPVWGFVSSLKSVSTGLPRSGESFCAVAPGAGLLGGGRGRRRGAAARHEPPTTQPGPAKPDDASAARSGEVGCRQPDDSGAGQFGEEIGRAHV